MVRKILLFLIVVSYGGGATIAGCKALQVEAGADSNQISQGSGHDHNIGGDGIEDGVTISHGELHIRNVWARPAFRSANSAVYLSLQNHGAKAERFLGATTEVAAAAEIHQVKMEGDLMVMSPVLNGVEVPAGGHVEFVPGGYHLMLIDLQSELTEGDYFPLALQFEQSGHILVDVLVSQN